MDEISIDRLVLDIPGLNAAQGRDLARRVGEGLAAASTAHNTTTDTGANFDALAVDLNDRAAAQGIPRLAEAIVNALLIQMGGR
jgi:hypothetical protein